MATPHDVEPLVHAATRFTPPRLRPEFVARPTLVDRLLAPGARLVVASGPAGSGKSTVLAQAYAACPDAVWLTLEPADDDPAVLWSAIIDSTAETVPGFGSEYRHRLDTGGAEALDTVLALYVNELAGTSRPIRLFLDDLHVLSGERSIGSLAHLLERLPPNNCLVIASRAASPIPLGRLRIERAVVEIGPLDLAMDFDEACAALSAAGIEPDDSQVATLVARTEGWVAGLAWATLVMQSRPDTGSFVETVNAIDGELTDYLIEELLEQRSPRLRAFMLDTSILARFNAALCDEVRGRDDSAALIEELDRTNSFLVSLDRRGEWFRYHQLVHDVLSTRLARESPASVVGLHRRASAWLGEHQEVVESIRHARAAGDDLRAADILCANWWEMMNGGRIETVQALFEECGSARICGYQPLAIAAALLYSLAGDHQHAQIFYRAAERGHHEGPPPDGSASMESSLAIMRGSVAFDGVDATLTWGAIALELEPNDSKWRPLALFLVGIGHVWRGELEEAEPKLEEIVRLDHGGDALILYAFAQLALIRLKRGDVDGASALAESACSRATEAGLESFFTAALAHGAAAAAQIAAGDPRAAEQHLDAAQVPMNSINTALPIDAMQTRIVLADAAIHLGRLSEARGYIEAASRTDQRYADAGILADQLAVLVARLGAVGEQTPVELSEREQSVLDLMPSELSIREMADELYVSKETVKTHRRHIYRKLGVATRDEAVVAARVLGLLPESGGDAVPPADEEADLAAVGQRRLATAGIQVPSAIPGRPR